MVLQASTSTATIFYQSYPVPTELPAMREGETDGRYMDFSPALNPVGDVIPDLSNVTVVVTRRDGCPMTESDIQEADVAWPATLDETGTILTYGWTAPVGSAGSTYTFTVKINPTKEGRTFIRDWCMSVLPHMG